MELIDLLNYDPLAAAEKITEEAYFTRPTSYLGIVLTFNHSKRLREALQSNGDSHRGISYSEWTALVSELGFTKIWSETFGETPEVQEAYWMGGMLLVAGSYSGKLNGAKLYFTAEVLNDAVRQLGLSGFHSFSKDPNTVDTFSGYLDVREGLKFKLGNILENTAVREKWLDGPRVWLANFEEELAASRGPRPDFDAINQQKLAQFPAAVREAMSANRII